MNNIYKSATLKLTISYLILVMSISIIFSGVVYHFATDTLANGLIRQEARIYHAFPVFTNNRFFIQDNDIRAGSHRILADLFYFNLLVLIGSGFASYWLAKRTLAPIEASNERQKRFVADASHELRTPLTALKMDTELALLDKRAPSSELRSALQSNLEETDKLTSLLNNLLRLSQLESGAVLFKFRQLSSASIISGAISEITSRAKSKNISLEEPQNVIKLQGDRDSLIQLLVILLDNAVKYSPHGSNIRISASSDKNESVISIIDNGKGIDQESLQHVFDRFYRADKSRSNVDGYGLGLSIAKEIADLHNGSISITSKVDFGTQASIHLPVYSEISNKA